MNIQIGLTPEAIAERRNFIGASDANTIMSGDAERINRLAREKLGLQEPEDLSRNLAVVMGSFTEELNRHWFELQTGDEVTGAGSLVTHPRHKFLRATLDGVVMARSAVFEAGVADAPNRSRKVPLVAPLSAVTRKRARILMMVPMRIVFAGMATEADAVSVVVLVTEVPAAERTPMTP